MNNDMLIKKYENDLRRARIRKQESEEIIEGLENILATLKGTLPLKGGK